TTMSTCSTCGKHFTKPALLKRHQVVHTKEKPFTCHSCPCAFSQKSSLQRHQRSCHVPFSSFYGSDPKGGEQVALEALGAYKSLQNGIKQSGDLLKSDSRLQEGDSPKCREVQLQNSLFPSGKSQILSVQQVERSSRRIYYVCEFCTKEFPKTYDLIRHRRSHTKEKPYPCRECFRRFSTRTRLNEHTKQWHFSSLSEMDAPKEANTGTGRRYKCVYCAHAFQQKINCRRHMLSHWKQHLPGKGSTKSKAKAIPFSCSSCGRSFKKSNDLSKHLATHSQAKPYVCELCQRSFNRKSTLKRHLQVHESQPPVINCQVCGRAYKSKSALCRHLRIHTGER
ncbi:hypothetical protein KR018_006365, partial [Drosophila ironensis]